MTGRTARLMTAVALSAAVMGLGAGSSPATPAACAAGCTVRADTNTGYVSPVLEIASGADVTWTPTTTSHPTAERQVQDPCFMVAVGAELPPNPVVFDASAAGVTATQNVTVGATTTRETKPCTGAVAIDDTAWAVSYQCRLHFWMNGTLIVDR